MFTGHFSAALAGRAVEPRLPLWTLFLAAQAVDVAFALLVMAGVERMQIDPSLPSNPLVLSYMPYTHGLPATLLWVAACFALLRALGAGARPAGVAAAVVGSHWVLDWLVHRPDLPLWDDRLKVGLALWNHPLPALLLELGLLLGCGLWLALSPGWPRERRAALGWLLAGLVVLQGVTPWVPAPPAPAAFAATMLGVFGVAAWAAARAEGRRRQAGA